MFSEWTDPYDIDNYYNDLSGVFKQYESLPSSSTYNSSAYNSSQSNVISKPENPTGIVVNNPTPNKSGFEVKPNSIFIDDHNVGEQPAYNILRSGPPKESFTDSMYCSYDSWIYVCIFVILIMFMCLLRGVYCKLNKLTKKLNKVMFLLYQHEKH